VFVSPSPTEIGKDNTRSQSKTNSLEPQRYQSKLQYLLHSNEQVPSQKTRTIAASSSSPDTPHTPCLPHNQERELEQQFSQNQPNRRPHPPSRYHHLSMSAFPPNDDASRAKNRA